MIFRREPRLTKDATEFLGLDKAYAADVLERFAKTDYLCYSSASYRRQARGVPWG